MVAMRLEGDKIVLELEVQPGKAGGYVFFINQTPKGDSGREPVRYDSLKLYTSLEEADAEGKKVLIMLAKGQPEWTNLACER